MGWCCMKREMLKILDENYNFIDKKEKMEVHKCGDLHEAVSVVIFNTQGKILIQKRSVMKYHSGGKWANSCCTHVRVGESIDEAVKRSMREELGIYIKTYPWFDFIYKSILEHDMIECELDHVFWGNFTESESICANEDEVQDYEWISINKLFMCYKQRVDFAPWFQHICNIIENIQDAGIYDIREQYRVTKIYLNRLPSVSKRKYVANLNNTKELYARVKSNINVMCNESRSKNIEHIVETIQYLIPSKIVLEENLSEHTETIDFSICIPREFLTCERSYFESLQRIDKENARKWKMIKDCITYMESVRSIEEVWLEYDNFQGERKYPVPCLFYDASHLDKKLLKQSENKDSVYGLLGKLLTIEEEQDKRLKQYICKILDAVDIYQFGILVARNKETQIRIYTKMFPFENIKKVLFCLQWEGCIENLIKIGEKYKAQSVDLSFTYDLKTGKILDEIGLSIYVLNQDAINVLYNSKYIDEKKYNQYCQWNNKQIKRTTDGSLLMYVRKFGYLKATFNKESLVALKSYLYYSQYLHK